MNNSVKKIILRILDISYRNKLSHVGSCISAAKIIYDIYNTKRDNDLFILSEGHAYLSQLVTLEYFGLIEDAEKVALSVGTHPKRDLKNHTKISTGSLGMGLPISVGFAMINKSRNVHCLISDGEISESSNWGALRFIDTFPNKENKYTTLSNLKIHINANGYSALNEVNFHRLSEELSGFKYCNINLYDTSEVLPYFSRGLDIHYKILNQEEYNTFKEYYESL